MADHKIDFESSSQSWLVAKYQAQFLAESEQLSNQGLSNYSEVYKLMTQLLESKELPTRVDFLLQIQRELESNVNIDVKLKSHLERALLETSLNRILSSRWRRQLINVYLKLRQLNSLTSVMTDENAKEICNSIKDECQIQTLSHDSFVQIIKKVVVIIDIPQVFNFAFWNSENDGVALSLFNCLHVYLKREIDARKALSTSSGELIDKLEKNQLLTEEEMGLFFRFLASFIPQFVKSFRSPPSSTCAKIFIQSIMSFLKSLMDLIATPSIPRECKTMCCNNIALLAYEILNVQEAIALTARLLSDCKIKNDPNLESQEDKADLESKLLSFWEHSKDTTTRIALVRGFLVNLGPAIINQQMRKPDLTIHLKEIFRGLCNTTLSSDLIQKLYCVETLSIWLQQTKAWFNLIPSFSEALRDFNAIEIVSVAISTIVKPLKPLKDQCLSTIRLVLESSDSTELSEQVYKKAMALGSSHRKFIYLILDMLVKKYGARFILEKQPYLVDHLLSGIGNRPTRSAALNLLMSIYSSNLYKSEYAQGLLEKAGQVLSGSLTSFSCLVDESDDQLLYPQPVTDSAKLAEHSSQYFLPLFAKTSPLHLVALYHHLQQSQSSSPWTSAQTAILKAARTKDLLQWNEESLVLTGNSILGEPMNLSVPLASLVSGSISSNSTIRLNIMTAATTCKQLARPPNDNEWLLLKTFVACSLKSATPEDRARTVTVVEQFIERAFICLRASLKVNKNSDGLISCIKLTHQALLFYLDPCTPFDSSGPAIEILNKFYSHANILAPEAIAKRFPSFYGQYCWEHLLACIATNWDRLRQCVTQILYKFPPPSNLRFSILVGCQLLQGLRQREFLGGAAALSVLAVVTSRNRESTEEFVKVFSLAMSSGNLILSEDSWVPPPKNVTTELRQQYVLFNICIITLQIIRNRIEGRDFAQPIHGLFRFLTICLEILNSSDCLYKQNASDTTECSLKHSEFMHEKVSSFVRELAEAQWVSAMYLLSLLSYGEDSVLIPGNLNGASFTAKKPYAARIKGVDCRGHPILINEEQHEQCDATLLSSWICVKEGADVMSQALSWIDLDSLVAQSPANNSGEKLNPSFFDLVGHRWMFLLLSVKHPAVTDRLWRLLTKLNQLMSTSSYASLIVLPKCWLNRLCFLLNPESSLYPSLPKEDTSPGGIQLMLPPPLRRSQSSGLTFLAILASENPRRPEMIHSTVIFLLGIADKKFEIEKDLFASRIHSLNILRSFVRTSSLSAAIERHLPALLALSTQLLADAYWPIRNAAHLLFASVVERLTSGFYALSGEESHYSESLNSPLSIALHGTSIKPKGSFFAAGACIREDQIQRARPLSQIISCENVRDLIILALQPTAPALSPLQQGVFQGLTTSTLLFMGRVEVDDPEIQTLILRCQLDNSCLTSRTFAARANANVFMQRYQRTSQALLALLRQSDTFQNNALHGLLAFVLEVLSRIAPAASFSQELFSETSEGALETLKLLENMLKSKNLAPLNRALILQVFEQIILALNDFIVQSPHLGATSMIMKYLPRAQELKHRIFHLVGSQFNVKETPGSIILIRSSVRLKLLSADSEIVVIGTSIIESALVHGSDACHPAAVIECLRVLNALHKYVLDDKNRYKFLFPDFDEAFVKVKPFQLATIRLCKELSQQLESYPNIIQIGNLHDVTSSCLYDLFTRCIKLLLRLEPLEESLHSLTQPMITPPQILNRSPRIIRLLLSIGPKLYRLKANNPNNDPNLCKAIKTYGELLNDSVSPQNEAEVRMVSVTALRNPIGWLNFSDPFLTECTFQIITAAIILLTDEIPEIQLESANFVSAVLKTLPQDCAMRSDKFLWRQLNENLFECVDSTSIVCLHRLIPILVKKFDKNLVLPWIRDLLSGKSPQLNLIPDLRHYKNSSIKRTNIQRRNQDDTETTQPFELQTFDEEPANIFNGDIYLLKLLVKEAMLEWPNPTHWKLIFQESYHLDEDITDQINTLYKIISDETERSNGLTALSHPTYSPIYLPSFFCLLLRVAVCFILRKTCTDLYDALQSLKNLLDRTSANPEFYDAVCQLLNLYDSRDVHYFVHNSSLLSCGSVKIISGS